MFVRLPACRSGDNQPVGGITVKRSAHLPRACALAVAVSAVLAAAAHAGGPIETPLAARLAADQLQQQAASRDEGAQRFIVLYRDSLATASAAARQERLETASREVGVEIRPLRPLSVNGEVIVLDSPLDAEGVKRLEQALHRDPDVLSVTEDVKLQRAFTPNDPLFALQWHYGDGPGGIHAEQAWDIATGEGVVVAVLDTGYLPHADLAPNLVSVGYDFIADPETSRKDPGRQPDAIDPGDWHDGECNIFGIPETSSWHGTHVAGTVAAVTDNGIGVAGVAFDAKVLPVRVLGKCGGFISDIADAITWASGGEVTDIPENPDPAEVINLSLGGGGSCNPAIQAAVDGAVSRGSTVVVAAGNSNANAGNFQPANCNGVVAVAATTPTGGKASYSNFGDVVAVAAPGGTAAAPAGDNVLSTLNTGEQGPEDDAYAWYAGTSMAAPHVAGIVALMQSATDEPLLPEQVTEILINTAYTGEFPTGCSHALWCGSGIANARYASAVAGGLEPLPDPPPPPPPPPPPQEIFNGVPVTGLGAASGDTLRYFLEVPDDASDLVVSISGGTGDADLYVRFGAEPTLTEWDCRPFAFGNNETCTFPDPQEGTWYVNVRAFSTFSGVTLQANFESESTPPPPPPPPPPTVDLVNGVTVTGLAGAAGEELHFVLDVPPGTEHLFFGMYGGTGDADMYVRFGERPTTTEWNCRPFAGGNNETCSLPMPQVGSWYVMVRGFSAFTGANLHPAFVDHNWPRKLVASTTPQGRNVRVDLGWEAGATNIDIHRNGSFLRSQYNTGTARDTLPGQGGNGEAVYTICNAGTTQCSLPITVSH